MKILIVEDDFMSRKLMLAYLSSLGECDVAANGREALEAYTGALDWAKPYNLICLDIMMPGMNGQEVLKHIRDIEEERGILPPEAAKVIMTTALKDSGNIMNAFKSQCEAYLVKPIDREKLMQQIKFLGLTSSDVSE